MHSMTDFRKFAPNAIYFNVNFQLKIIKKWAQQAERTKTKERFWDLIEKSEVQKRSININHKQYKYISDNINV